MRYSADFFDFSKYDIPTETCTDTAALDKDVFILLLAPTTPAEQDLLTKILAAVKLSEGDYNIITMTKDDQRHLHFAQHKTYLCFGIQPEQLYLRTEKIPYYPFQIRDAKIVFSHTLTILSEHVKAKKALWVCLQQLFLQANN